MRGEVHILVYCPIDTFQWGSTHSALCSQGFAYCQHWFEKILIKYFCCFTNIIFWKDILEGTGMVMVRNKSSFDSAILWVYCTILGNKKELSQIIWWNWSWNDWKVHLTCLEWICTMYTIYCQFGSFQEKQDPFVTTQIVWEEMWKDTLGNAQNTS